MNYLVSAADTAPGPGAPAGAGSAYRLGGDRPAHARVGPKRERVKYVAFPAGPAGAGNSWPLEAPLGRDRAGVRGLKALSHRGGGARRQGLRRIPEPVRPRGG